MKRQRQEREADVELPCSHTLPSQACGEERRSKVAAPRVLAAGSGCCVFAHLPCNMCSHTAFSVPSHAMPCRLVRHCHLWPPSPPPLVFSSFTLFLPRLRVECRSYFCLGLPMWPRPSSLASRSRCPSKSYNHPLGRPSAFSSFVWVFFFFFSFPFPFLLFSSLPILSLHPFLPLLVCACYFVRLDFFGLVDRDHPIV